MKVCYRMTVDGLFAHCDEPVPYNTFTTSPYTIKFLKLGQYFGFTCYFLIDFVAFLFLAVSFTLYNNLNVYISPTKFG